MKPKAALVKANLKPAGFENSRGRMSAADKEAIEKLANEHPDWNIEGFGANAVSAVEKSEAKAAVKPVSSTGVVDIGPPRRHEDSFKALAYAFGKDKPVQVGMKTVCNNCRNSLTYCICSSSVVNIDHKTVGIVEFKAV